MKAIKDPQTLQDAIIYFSDPVRCREFMVALRWPNGVICPRCGSKKCTSRKSTTAGSAPATMTGGSSP
jgi:hypothetical protein